MFIILMVLLVFTSDKNANFKKFYDIAMQNLLCSIIPHRGFFISKNTKIFNQKQEEKTIKETDLQLIHI